MRPVRSILVGLLLAALAALFLTSQWIVGPSGSNDPHAPWRLAFTHYLIICSIWGVLALIPLRLASRIELMRGHWIRDAILLLSLGLVLSLLHVVITSLGRAAFDSLSGNRPSAAFATVGAYFVRSLPSNMIIYLVIVSVIISIKANRKSHESALRAAELETQLKDAQLVMLTNQLQPHFLFNTLNAIASLVRESPAAAEEMVIRLSHLLRASLDSNGQHEVPLADELMLLQKYVDIQRARFAEKISVNLVAEDDCLEALVPAFVLQPLIENAIEHGFCQPTQGAEIVVSIQHAGEFLQVIVADNGAGWTGTPVEESGGTGIANTAARLKRLYGDCQRFSYGNRAQGGFRVELEVPYRTNAMTPRAEQAQT